jgi:MSHA biogenesis protein MshO
MRRKPARFVKLTPRGFTLVEAVIAIAILGVVGAMMAVFIKMPVMSYVSTSRRAELTDSADTAVQRLKRDLARAIPNTVRVTTVGGKTYLEFMMAKAGGMYRAACSTTACTGEDILDFSSSDTSFDVLGGLNTAPSANDYVVVFNLGVPGADAYAQDNIAKLAAGTTANKLVFAAKTFPFSSPSQRFQVMESDSPVTYECAPSSSTINSLAFGTGTLKRYAGYGIQAGQPTAFASGTSAILAGNISSCAITPPENMNLPGMALVSISFTMTLGGESISIYHEAHINNVP